MLYMRDMKVETLQNNACYAFLWAKIDSFLTCMNLWIVEESKFYCLYKQINKLIVKINYN